MNASVHFPEAAGLPFHVLLSGIDATAVETHRVKLPANLRALVQNVTVVTREADTVSDPATARLVEFNPDASGTLVKAAVTTATGVSNGELVFTAVPPGTVGNGTTVRYVNPGAAAALSVSVANKAITVNLGYQAAVKASVQNTLGGLTARMKFEAVDAGSGGNAIDVVLLQSQLEGPLSVDVFGADIEVTLAAGPALERTTTAAEVVEAINQHAGASLLIVASLVGDGTGIVQDEELDLTGGVQAGLISTATQVAAAIAASAEAKALVTVANKQGNNGSGVLIAMNAVTLTGGVDDYAEAEVQDVTASADLASTPAAGEAETIAVAGVLLLEGAVLGFDITTGATATADVIDVAISGVTVAA